MSGDRASWVLGALLTVAMGVSTFLPLAIGAVGPFVTEDLGLSRSQFGALVTTLFAVATVVSFPSGQIADRLDGRVAIVGLFGVAALSWIAASAAPTYGWLLLAMGLGGLVQAAANPFTNRLLSRHFPAHQRGGVLGMKQAGVQLGAFLAAVLPVGAARIGWRPMLQVVAGIPLVMGLVAARTMPRDGAARATPVPAVTRRTGEPSVVRWMTAHGFCMGSGLAALATYLPLYAYEQLGVDAALAGLPSGILAVTAMGSRLAWGIASDRIARLSAVLVLIASLSTASVLLVVLAVQVGFWLLCVGGFAIGATASAWNALATLEVIRRVGSSQAGRATGILFAGFFAGWLVAPVSSGRIVDVTRSYIVVWCAVMGLFACAAVIALGWHRRSARAAAATP